MSADSNRPYPGTTPDDPFESEPEESEDPFQSEPEQPADEENQDAFAPTTDAQRLYVTTLLQRLSEHDWSDTVGMRTRKVITLLNEARREAQIPFKPIKDLGY